MKKEFKKLKIFSLIFLFTTFFLMIWYVSNIVFAYTGPSANPLVQPIQFVSTCYSTFGERLICEEGYVPECVEDCAGLNEACSINGDCCETNHVCKSWGVCQPIGEIADACVVDADCGENPYEATNLICDSYDDTCRIDFESSCAYNSECASDFSGQTCCLEEETCLNLMGMPPPPGMCGESPADPL